jgi:hypothetical protein
LNHFIKQHIGPVLLAAIVLVLLVGPCLTAQAGPATTTVSGVRLNNGLAHGVFGTFHRLTDDFSEYVGLDLGGDAGSLGTITFRKLYQLDRWRLWAVLGPNLEYISIDGTPDYSLLYFTAATGLVLDFQVNPKASIWLGFNYLVTEADISPYKIGIGLLSSSPF